MSADPIKQGRGLFGRKREDVDPGASETELRLRAAEGRAQAAESRVGDLQAELAFYGDAIRSLKSELEVVTERVVSRVAPQVVELEARNAETEALRETVTAMQEEAQNERDQLLSWRREMEARVANLHRDIDAAHRSIDGMPEQIRDALTPTAEAIATVSASMTVLAGTWMPPSVMSGPIPEEPRGEPEPAWAEHRFPPAPEVDGDGSSGDDREANAVDVFGWGG
jgi:hypothetical protein